jgi:hypothetical protein
MSQVQQRLMPELKKGESQKKRTVPRLDLNFGAYFH